MENKANLHLPLLGQYSPILLLLMVKVTNCSIFMSRYFNINIGVIFTDDDGL